METDLESFARAHYMTGILAIALFVDGHCSVVGTAQPDSIGEDMVFRLKEPITRLVQREGTRIHPQFQQPIET